MAVCSRCGASTSAVRCPRCGGETTPFATPRPETERGPAQRPPAGTTTRLPVVTAGEPAPAAAPSSTASAAPTVTSAPPAAGGTPSTPPARSAAAGAPEPDRDPFEATTVLPPVTVRSAGASRPASAPRTTESAPRGERTGSTRPSPRAPRPGARPTGRRRGLAPLAVLAAVLVAVVAAGVWWLLARRPESLPAAVRPAPVTVVELPAGAHACPESDAPDSGLQVYAGNPTTSCGFALNVRTALGDRKGSTTVEAYSPKTHERYTVTCEGETPVQCVGANNALVYLLARTVRVTVGQ